MKCFRQQQIQFDYIVHFHTINPNLFCAILNPPANRQYIVSISFSSSIASLLQTESNRIHKAFLDLVENQDTKE